MSAIFPGIPRIESPLFRPDDPAYGFSAEDQATGADLSTRGYAVIDFPDPDIDARIERIKANLAPRLGIDLINPGADKTAAHRRIQDAWTFDQDVRAIAGNTQILALLERLYGRRAFPFQTLNFPLGTQQAAHSDSVHFSSLPERFMCGVWLAMEDIHPDAGPLFYIPGSHRWPIVSNLMIGRRGHGSALSSAQDPYGPAWRALQAAFGAEEGQFLARKGQALIWCANLLHGGSPQTNPSLTRWSQVTHYFFDDCIYYTPAFSDEAVGRLDMRRLVDITDGAQRANSFLGEILPLPRPPRLGSIRKRARTLWRQLSAKA
ncbi:phytanoyl-CoA dioxygenase family protein [Novosphingobium sp. CF614]|uniref:phytanoyl-CoA dioxygenase family protein n=1 Tax=Novosphingobium sp. CF614 TaxID=1884364 RepID=UPI000B886ADD|nr:phytanoyl-CoA dioxygenase family protein [Novosphingobium sp. CF614]